MAAEEIVGRLAKAARGTGLDPTALEIADTLWLAARIASALDPDPHAAPADPSDPSRPQSPPHPAHPTVSAPRSPAGPKADGNKGRADVGGGARTAPGGHVEAEVRPHTPEPNPVTAVVMRAPDAPALGRRGLGRALRSLKRLTFSGPSEEIDPFATADRSARAELAGARTGSTMPVFRQRRDRWLDVAVVVDDSSSMVISRRTVRELIETLRETGAFRDVRTWHTNSDNVKDGIRLRAEDPNSDRTHQAAELIDPAGRRVVLVASDCVGRGWRDGSMAEALQAWAKAGPTAIVQPLPQTLWDRAGLDVRGVVLSSMAPGAANGDLRIQLRDGPLDPFVTADAAMPNGIVIPVLELSERWLAGWSDLVADSGGKPYTGPAVFTGAMNPPDWSDPTDPESGSPRDARDAVDAFAAEASPEALHLARLFAAAAPLTLPVMRLVQHTMLPEIDPTALREVFLGGLLIRKGEPAKDPDETVYDFAEATRTELIAQLGTREAIRVLTEVSRYLSGRLGMDLDFLAVLAWPQYRPTPVEGPARAFAKVAVKVLTSLGGRYADTAARLQQLLPGPHAAKAEPPVSANSLETSGDSSMTGTLSPVIVPIRPTGYEPAGWKTVPLRNSNFVGREQMLDNMHDLLINSEQTAVLLPRAFYGLGGVGKTQLAIEYAHRHMREFDLVWWIAAEDPAEIRRSLVELANILGVAVTGDARSTIVRVLNALNRPTRYPRWLLVFDNVGEPDSVRGLLPSSQAGQVLITSRETRWASEGQSVEVDKFARPESIELLSRQGGLPADTAAIVAERLDDMPISLAQAGAWLTATSQPYTVYLQRLDEALASQRSGDGDPGYPPQAAAAMSVAFDGLRVASEDAALLLQLASYFGPEWIALDLLYRGRHASTLTRQLGRTLRDHEPLNRAVKEIARWELARNDTRNVRFQVHRLVRHMVQSQMSDDLRRDVRDTVRVMLSIANPGNPDLIPALESAKHAELSAHITAAELIESDDIDARQVVLDQIRYRYLTGDYVSSLELADQALGSWPDHDELTLIARRHRAGALAALGRHAEALEIGQAVRQDFERMEIFGANHPHTMATINGIGRDLRALGRFADAYVLDRENYRRQAAILGSEDRATIRTANNYAVDMRMLGEYEHALERDQQTAAESLLAWGPNDNSYLVALSNVARDLYALGRYQEALNLQRGSLPVYEKVSGATHPEVLLARRTVVMCLRKLGLTQEAVDEGESLLLAFRNRFGDRHPNTLLVMQSLMNALRNNNDPATNDLDRAITLGEEALAGYESALPEHPFRQICAANLAIAYRNKSQDLVGRARAMNESALESLTGFFGARNPYTLCCATNLANDLAAQREYERARDLSGDVLVKSREVRGERQPYTLACAVNHAIDLMKTNDPGGADAYAAAIKAMKESPDLGPDHPEVTLASLGKRIDCDIEAPPT